jgi:hypothetical protein
MVVASMYWRARRLYEAVLILLKAHLPEEAAIIARSLFEAAMRLMQLAADAHDREALIIGWAGGSIDQREGLFRTAKSLGLDEHIDELLNHFAEERKALQKYADGRRWKSFDSVAVSARRYCRPDDFWTYELAHESVHGSDAATLFSTRADGNARRLHGKVNDPSLLGAFAHFAARAVADAAISTYRILGWTPVPNFEEPVQAMEQLLGEHQDARRRADTNAGG